MHYSRELHGLPVRIQTQPRCHLESVKLYCLSLSYLRDHLSAFHKANFGTVLLTVPCCSVRGWWGSIIPGKSLEHQRSCYYCHYDPTHIHKCKKTQLNKEALPLLCFQLFYIMALEPYTCKQRKKFSFSFIFNRCHLSRLWALIYSKYIQYYLLEYIT